MLSGSFFLTSFLFPTIHGLGQWKALILGKEKFTSLLFLDGGALVATSGLMVLSALLFPGNYLILIVMVFLIPATLNLVMTTKNLVTIPKDASREKNDIGYGIKTSIYSSFNMVSTHIDKLLLFFFLSPEALATYVAADRLAELLRSVSQDTAASLAPRFAKQKIYTDGLDKALKMFCVILGGAMILFAFSMLPWILALIYGDSYRDAIPYCQALVCSVALVNLPNMRFRFIRSHMDHANYRTIMTVTSISKILSSLLLIPILGILGAVLSVFAYRLSMILVVSIVYKKDYLGQTPVSGVDGGES
jgi:O-antigen/teichoic acid export membrane protein